MIYIGILIVVVVQQPPQEVTPEAARSEPDGSNGYANGFVATCKKCDWQNTYATQAKSRQALGGHSRFCQGVRGRVSPFSKPF